MLCTIVAALLIKNHLFTIRDLNIYARRWAPTLLQAGAEVPQRCGLHLRASAIIPALPRRIFTRVTDDEQKIL